jgi:regulatory subunit for Cdc7p protein kinase
MAAVSVQLSPHVTHNMASRRTPLSNIPNAGNSPFRGTPGSAKRARAQANSVRDVENSVVQPPPSKRQAVEADSTGPVTPRKTRGDQSRNPVTPTQRQHASRTREFVRTQKQEHLGESMEKLRQWQKHIEKTFPTYVFFFENVPEAARRECGRGIRYLGSVCIGTISNDLTNVLSARSYIFL